MSSCKFIELTLIIQVLQVPNSQEDSTIRNLVHTSETSMCGGIHAQRVRVIYRQFDDLLQLDELQRIINVGSQSENI